jgi:anti-anti-sigma regulatory factor
MVDFDFLFAIDSCGVASLLFIIDSLTLADVRFLIEDSHDEK